MKECEYCGRINSITRYSCLGCQASLWIFQKKVEVLETSWNYIDSMLLILGWVLLNSFFVLLLK